MKRKIFFIVLTAIVLYLAWMFYKANTEVLSTFGIMNEKFEEANKAAQNTSDSLKLKVNYTEYVDKVKVVDSVSENLIHHIEVIKNALITNVEDPTDYSKMDSTIEGDAFFFSNGKHSEAGEAFVNEVENYKAELHNLFHEDFSKIIQEIDSKFNYREDIRDWLDYNFKGLPLIATITKLTAMQSDIQQIKQDLFVAVLSKE